MNVLHTLPCMLETVQGMFINASELRAVRFVSKQEANDEMPAGIYFQLRTSEDNQWMRIHPQMEEAFGNSIQAMAIRATKGSPIMLPN